MPRISASPNAEETSLTDRSIQNWEIHDPELTELGLEQCGRLAAHLSSYRLAKQIEFIAVSAMRRTVETAHHSLGWLITDGVPVECYGFLQECSEKPCDTGMDLDQSGLKQQFPQFDFSNVYPEWPEKKGIYAFNQEAVTERGRQVRRWLKSRPEKVVAVVTHSAFLRLGVTHDRFANADFRVYHFSDRGDELVQYEETAESGGGLGLSSKEKSMPKPSDFVNGFGVQSSPLAVGKEASQKQSS